ncbi:uncharacterized protein VP01_8604g1 [Puccinia sorghi]|uniref:Uncharacterized protein n=1 Tax=Puccinia sorghi TaxID=27349 RepID=A0A0L6UB18_9BASI|nr:uncharacterized protein VP01_8604g1 [Puccinia sorghi]
MPKKATPKPMKPTTKKPAIQRKSKKNRGKHSYEDDGADKKAIQLKKEDYLVIIEWLKIEWNYNSCFGTGKAPSVGLPAKDKYNKFHTKYISTGFGLTNEDLNTGISKIDEKLESMCTHYHVMNDLMGADNKTETSSF